MVEAMIPTAGTYPQMMMGGESSFSMLFLYGIGDVMPQEKERRERRRLEAVQVPPGRLRLVGLLSTRHQSYVATGNEST